jgi:hypothetical protein
LSRYERLAIFRDWTLGSELPGLHDGGQPGIELLVGCHLVEVARVDKPDFAGVAHDRIAAVEHRRGHTIDRHVSRLLHSGGLVGFELRIGDLRAVVGRDVHLEADVRAGVLQGDGEGAASLVVRLHLQVRGIVNRKVIVLIAIQ